MWRQPVDENRTRKCAVEPTRRPTTLTRPNPTTSLLTWGCMLRCWTRGQTEPQRETHRRKSGSYSTPAAIAVWVNKATSCCDGLRDVLMKRHGEKAIAVMVPASSIIDDRGRLSDDRLSFITRTYRRYYAVRWWRSKSESSIPLTGTDDWCWSTATTIARFHYLLTSDLSSGK